MGICKINNKIVLVSELADGTLKSVLEGNGKRLSLIKRLSFGLEAAKGIRWLHNNRVIHRDIKLENLLIKNGVVKVTDFGLSNYLLDAQKENCVVGTPLYLAPELFRGSPFDEKVDVYAFGIVLYQLLELKPPFNDYKSFKDLKNGVTNGDRPKFSPEYSKDVYKPLINLINSCWNENPEKRPSFGEIEKNLLDIMASLTIPAHSESQRCFWTEKIGCYDISFDKFIQKFLPSGIEKEYRNICIDMIKRCIGDNNVSRGDTKVSIENFGEFVQHHWREGFHVNDIITEIINLFNNCFHGNVESGALKGLLSSTGVNSHLLRYSNSKSGAFVLSVYNSNTSSVINYTIRRDEEGIYKCNSIRNIAERNSIGDFLKEILKHFPESKPCIIEMEQQYYPPETEQQYYKQEMEH